MTSTILPFPTSKSTSTPKPITTFVTSYINYYRTSLENTTHFIRLSKFKPLLQSKLNLLVFVTPDCFEPLHEFLKSHCPSYTSRIKIAVLKQDIFHASSIFTTKWNLQLLLKLPSIRFEPKDTLDFLCYTHTKVELLRQAIDLNPFDNSQYAWIDFNICDLFQHKSNTLHTLEILASQPLSHNQIILPGCWDFPQTQFTNAINWRFCGGFAFGTTTAIQDWWQLYETYFEPFLQSFQTMVWDVNFWAWLESNPDIDWNPLWYKADHNDSLIQIPLQSFCSPISKSHTQIHTIDFPTDSEFIPVLSSVVYVPHLRMYIMNTTRKENSEVNPTLRHVCTFVKLPDFSVDSERGHHVMQTPQKLTHIQLRVDPTNSKKVQYIALDSEGHHVLGQYDFEQFVLQKGVQIDPPETQSTSPHWVSLGPNRDLFVYQWTPKFQIGTHEEYIGAGENDHTLNITHECHIQDHLMNVYGVVSATPFHWSQNGYVGCVKVGGQYRMVLLDLDTYFPKAHSDLFRFFDKEFSDDRETIVNPNSNSETCISMSIYQKQYVFWVTYAKMIRCVKIPMDELPWTGTIITG